MSSHINASITIPPLPSQKHIGVIDVGGTHVKIYSGSQEAMQMFASGHDMTPESFIQQVLQCVDVTQFEGLSIGFPSPVKGNRILKEPANLAKGWVGFDFTQALSCPVKLINDAAMQAVGSYEGGSMLFLGLGTGLGSTLIVDNQLQPMELAHMPFRDKDYEYYVSEHHREQVGDEQWHRDVFEIADIFYNAFMPDYIVLGGGNIHHLVQLPAYIKRGDNDKAYPGGIRLWGNKL